MTVYRGSVKLGEHREVDMEMSGAEAVSTSERMKTEWSHLSEDEKGLLLPHLLNEMLGWKVRASNPYSLMNWIEGAFRKAGVPYPNW